MLKQVNTTLLTLVAKVDNPNDVSQFRPIACCTVVYKIISKVLANRLQKVLPRIIGDEQSAFVKGRNIHDNIFLAHTLMKHYGRVHISPRVMIKVDIQKAFDSLNWDFLKNILGELRFPLPFIDWITECISSVYFSIAINGGTYGFFKGQRGLRQGDPISPYLFVIAMEVLSRQLRDCRGREQFSLHPKCCRINLTHLAFADDLLIFVRGDTPSVLIIHGVLLEFAKYSGLSPNPSKTSIYFGGVHASVKYQILTSTGFKEGVMPFRYLGLPLGTATLTVRCYKPLLNRISQKLQHWSNQYLSYAGKLQLLRSVIFSILVFWCSIFLLPTTVVQQINRLCSNFYWGMKEGKRGLHWIKWDTFAYPVREGGVNLKDIHSWNIAACMKWIWKLQQNDMSIWGKWTTAYVTNHSDIWNVKIGLQDSWLWKQLSKLRDMLLSATNSYEEAAALLHSWTVNGKYQNDNAYQFFRPKKPRVKAYDVLWNRLSMPRHTIIAWVTYQKRLATLDNLQRKGVCLVNRCYLCCVMAESHEHLFFECNFTKQLWRSLLQWLGYRRGPWALRREVEWLHKLGRAKHPRFRLCRAALVAVIYFCWRERNDRAFNNHSTSLEKIGTQIKFVLACRLYEMYPLQALNILERLG